MEKLNFNWKDGETFDDAKKDGFADIFGSNLFIVIAERKYRYDTVVHVYNKIVNVSNWNKKTSHSFYVLRGKKDLKAIGRWVFIYQLYSHCLALSPYIFSDFCKDMGRWI